MPLNASAAGSLAETAVDDYYFFVFIAVAVVEMLLSTFWNRFYFTAGIPIFRQSVALRLNELPTPDQLAEATKSRWTGRLIFHRFETGEVAFREKAFGGGLFHATPVMHGIIRQNPAEPSVEVVGLMNWFVPLLIMIVFAMTRNDAPGALVFLVVGVVLLYLLQRRRFRGVAAAVDRRQPTTIN